MMYYCVLVIMTLMGAVASLYLKKASASDKIIVLIKNKNLYLGGILYVASAILNIYILCFLDYSVVLPLTSLTYIWTLVIAKIVLGENVSKKKMLGVGLILVGAVIIANT